METTVCYAKRALETTDVAQKQPTSAPRAPGRPREADPVWRWPSLTVHLPPWLIAEFGRLAGELGMSRVGLIREMLEGVGLAYARELVRRQQMDRKTSAS